MENDNILDQGLSSQAHEGLTAESKNYLYTAARWAKFLGIVGFIFTGLIIIGLLTATFLGASVLGSSDLLGVGAGVGIIALIFYGGIVAVIFYTNLCLYRFGTRTLAGLESSSAGSLTEGFKNLKNYFLIFGILTAIVLGIYALVFLFGIGTAAMM